MSPDLYLWLGGAVVAGVVVAASTPTRSTAPRLWPTVVGLGGVVAALLAVGILGDTWMTAMPLADIPRPFAALDCAPGTGPIMELPLGDTYPDVAAMYRQMSHRRPVVNGYSGYFPPHYASLRFGLALREHDVLTELAARGITDVIVDREDRDGRWEKYVASHPRATLVCTAGKQSLYRVAPEDAATLPPDAQSPLQISVIHATVNEDLAALMTDRDRTTRWQSGPQTSRTFVELDFGGVRTVTGIDLLLGPFGQDFPRRLIIEASEDGTSWRELWQGGSAGLAFAAALESPLDIPMRYRFAPAPAQKLRMRLTKDDDTYYWSIAELKVMGR